MFSDELIKKGDPGSPSMLNPMLGMMAIFRGHLGDLTPVADAFHDMFEPLGVRNTRTRSLVYTTATEGESLGRALINKQATRHQITGRAEATASEIRALVSSHPQRTALVSHCATSVRSIDSIKFNPIVCGAMSGHNDPRSQDTASDGQFTLDISLGTVPNPQGAEEVVLRLLERSATMGEMHHATIDVDWYVSNFGSEWMQGICQHCPRLPDREAAWHAWSELGDQARAWARDPREAVALGPRLLHKAGARTPEGLRRVLRSEGVETERLRFSALPRGAVLVLISPNLGDFEQSIRRNPETRRISAQVRDALIRRGVVHPATVIPYHHWAPDQFANHERTPLTPAHPPPRPPPARKTPRR